MDDEANQAPSTRKPSPRRTITVNRWLINLVVIVLIALAAFAGGVQYEKKHGHSSAATVATANGQRGFGGANGGSRGFNRSGGFGQVTAVSASSITVSDQRSGASKTYTISSSTAITDSGNTVSYTDITVGETVVITTSSATSTTATRILVNPSFGGGQ